MREAIKGKEYTSNDDGSFNIKCGGRYFISNGKLMRKESDDESVDTSPIDLEEEENEVQE